MTAKGQHLSEEAKEKVRLSQLISWRDTDRRTKPIHRLPHSKQTKENISKGLKGHTFTPETKIKISNTLKGQIIKPETRQKISITLKAKIASGKYTPKLVHTKGIKRSKEVVARMSIISKAFWQDPTLKLKASIAQKQRWTDAKYRQSFSGSNSHFWEGGKSFLTYPSKWNASSRDNIKQRDNYTCQLCCAQFLPSQHKLSVHHINYDKHDCAHINLITLCKKCHGLSNVNRPYWQDFFTNLMIFRYIVYVI